MRLVVVLAAFVATLATPSVGSAAAGADPLRVAGIAATFDEATRSTTYRVDLSGGQQPLRYAWQLTLEAVDPSKPVDPGCDNDGVASGSEPMFVWHHGNRGDPVRDDGCDHALQGAFGHQGLVTVTVTDAAGIQCVARYRGSLTGSSVAQDKTTPPACRQLPACACTKLVVRIPPGSLKLEFDASGRGVLTFTLHWTMTCSKGGTGCTGSVAFDRVRVRDGFGDLVTLRVAPVRPLETATIACRGPCARVVEGGQPLRYQAGDNTTLVGLTRSDLARLGRLPVVVRATCQARKLKPIRLSIAFDRVGRLDRERSVLH